MVGLASVLQNIGSRNGGMIMGVPPLVFKR